MKDLPPQFNSVARRKMGALLAQGFRVVGVTVGRRDGASAATLTSMGRVTWHDGGGNPVSQVATEELEAELARRRL